MRDLLFHAGFVMAEAAISILLPVLLGYAIAAIRDVRLRNYVDTLVRYAAQRIPSNSERYRYVAEQVATRYHLDERDIEHIIEAAVHAIKETPDAQAEASVTVQTPNT